MRRLPDWAYLTLIGLGIVAVSLGVGLLGQAIFAKGCG